MAQVWHRYLLDLALQYAHHNPATFGKSTSDLVLHLIQYLWRNLVAIRGLSARSQL
jgi:hypothetical protein